MTAFRLKGTSGPVINQAWSLEARTVIGSADDCDVQLQGGGVAPHHAALVVGDGTITLELLADSGEVFVNGESTRQVPLLSGDEIRIGSCRWLLQAPGLRPEKVLTEAAVRRRVNLLPWVIAGALSALGLLAWRLGYLPF